MIDRKKVRNHADHIEARLLIRKTDLQKEIDEQIARLPHAPRGIWWQWDIVQILVTFLSAVIAAALFWVRTI